jgi:hypothetical protein
MRLVKFVGAAAVAVGLMAADSPVGTWRGESLCTPEAPAACNNEKVVYYVRPIAGNDSAVFVQADKIVDGKAVTMGTGPWKYDRERKTLAMEPPETGWVGRIQGKRIEATLVRGGVLLRRMTLVKDE